MRVLPAIALAAALAAPAALAQKNADLSGAVATGPGQAKAVVLVTANAKVESVDAAARTVTLKLKDGKTRTVTIGDDVRNFDQIKAGDTVKAKYVESLNIELKKDGKAILGRSESKAVDRAPSGAKPGGLAMHEVTVVTEVTKVDAAKHLVQVKNAQGDTFDLDVRDPEQLKLVKKGDQVEATYTQALAVALEPAAPAKKK
jgi:Cu/Ag efflux protein CusF